MNITRLLANTAFGGALIIGLTSMQLVQGESERTIVSNEKTSVQTIYGKIQGYLDGSIYTFKGIPYAKAERFMPPQAPDKFSEVKMCRVYGPKAPQGENLSWRDPQSDYDFGFGFNIEPMDEKNCLVLNVWTRGINDGKKRPVFVWIHGGGFTSGSGHDLPCYEGRSLAEKGDIVVVSINHRLNILGYIDLTAIGGKYSESVNLGMKDIVKSLEWVRDNIAQFGGDPNNVTIGGQSGGGGKVSTIMGMPSAKGLFNKAIVQSGSMMGYCNKEFSQRLGLAILETLGLKREDADKLSGFTYEQLVEAGRTASQKVNTELKGKGQSGFGGFAPVLDGKSLVEPLFNPQAPEVSRDIPMLIGTNQNEFVYNTDNRLTMDEAKEKLASRMGKEQSEKYVEAFGKVYPGFAPKDLLNLDMFVRPSAVKQAMAKSAQKSANAYLYLFTWHPQGNVLGACHGMELPFMFNNISLQKEMTGATKDAYKLADIMSSSWISFIKTGNPNVPGLPQWEPFNEKTGATMILDNHCRIVHNLDNALMQFTMPSPFSKR